ncbi:hypothetical protein SAMD00023353_4700620 [Rosellinia necatrix]|uniref:Uncharacterized protein n=1 Tax=Rosellinia necatrix TaxID=77044 RepID=A0A1S8A9F1_ROSNE|nr:hypothetical protein SAMD00023353_4700620 [Rosellinia necatrix]
MDAPAAVSRETRRLPYASVWLGAQAQMDTRSGTISSQRWAGSLDWSEVRGEERSLLYQTPAAAILEKPEDS